MRIRQALNRLSFEKDLVKNHEVSAVVVRQNDRLVLNPIRFLPFKRDLPAAEFILQSVLIDHFIMSLPKFAVHLHAHTDDLEGLLFINEFAHRSEERRVGKECRSRWETY